MSKFIIHIHLDYQPKYIYIYIWLVILNCIVSPANSGGLHPSSNNNTINLCHYSKLPIKIYSLRRQVGRGPRSPSSPTTFTRRKWRHIICPMVHRFNLHKPNPFTWCILSFCICFYLPSIHFSDIVWFSNLSKAATGMQFFGIKTSRMLDSCAFQKKFTSYN